MYEVTLSNRASNFYERLPANIQSRINTAVDSLEVNPFIGPNIKKLTGKLAGLYRYRVGNMRIIYQVFETKLKVVVIEIGSRGDVYK